MKKNQSGVTLISLVVTIVVMLILAATALAMLSGDSGIITNAQKARAANTESTVAEIMSTAYNTVQTEATTKMATSVGYRPNQQAQSLMNLVVADIGTGKCTTYDAVDQGNVPDAIKDTTNIDDVNGYFVYLENGTAEVKDGDGNVTSSYPYVDIVMLYRDTTFDLALEDETPAEGVYPVDNQYPQLEARIRLTTGGVSYIEPIRSTLV